MIRLVCRRSGRTVLRRVGRRAGQHRRRLRNGGRRQWPRRRRQQHARRPFVPEGRAPARSAGVQPPGRPQLAGRQHSVHHPVVPVAAAQPDLLGHAAPQPVTVAVQPASIAAARRLRDHTPAAARAQLGQQCGRVHAHRPPGRPAGPGPAVRAGLRQPGPAHHGRRQLGAVADQGGGRLAGPRAPAHAAVQSDAAAQDQAVPRGFGPRSRGPSQAQQRGRGRPGGAVARAQVAVRQERTGRAAVGRLAQRAAAQLLAAGGDGHAEQEQLGAEPRGHPGVGRAQAGQPDERQAQGAAQAAAKAPDQGRPVVRRRGRGRHRSVMPRQRWRPFVAVRHTRSRT